MCYINCCVDMDSPQISDFKVALVPKTYANGGANSSILVGSKKYI